METTRRRFMLGIGATGALAALPIPLGHARSVALAEPEGWRAYGQLWSDIKAICVGPIELSDHPPADLVTLDGLRIVSFVADVPFIDVTSPGSACREYQVCGPRETRLTFSGPISKELQDKFLSGERIKGSFALPGNDAPTDPESATDRVEGPSAEDKLGAELQSYLALPHGWDGYDGVPPSLDAVTDAFLFLAVRPDDIPLPYPQIGSNGEVGLYWHTAEVFAEVGFYGDGEYSYYARYTPADRESNERGRERPNS